MARALVLVGVLIVLVAPVASAAVPTFNTIRMYSEAEFTAAIKPYTDAIARNANDSEAYHWLGVAYLHAFRLSRFDLAPYARGFGGRAVEALERSMQLKADPTVMLALLEAYVDVGKTDGFVSIMDRLGALAQPLPPK